MASVMFLDMLSQPCRAVFIFVKMNKLPVDIKTLSLMNGEHYSEEFVKVNPLRRVPAFKHGDFCMGDSIAMMEYMTQVFDVPDHWYPKDPQKRVRVNEYLGWQHLGIRMHGSKMLYLKLIAPIVFKLEVPENKMAEALEDLNRSLDQIENTFIQDEGFIGGNEISIADLLAIGEVMQPFGCGVDVFKSRPRLREWKERVAKVVGKKIFDEAHAKVLSAKDVVSALDPALMEGFRPFLLRLIN